MLTSFTHLFKAKNPRRAIPVAIIVTLVMVVIAYVSCSAVMTLMVPYYTLDKSAGLVQVWGKLGYPSIEWMVSIGKQQSSQQLKECHWYIIMLQAKPAFCFGLWDQVHANIRQPRD